MIIRKIRFICNYVFRFIASGRLHAKIDKVTYFLNLILKQDLAFFLVYLWHWPKFEINVKWEISVLRIRDVYPGSRILIFTHPGSRIPDPGSKNR
jgi:hypothetical protein